MHSPTPERLVETSAAIGRDLLAEARLDADGGLAWDDASSTAGGPPDTGAYSGRIGEALFFAALYTATGDPEHEEAALRASRALRQGLRDAAYRDALADRIGTGIGGVGSIVYAFARMADFLGRPELLTDAGRAADAITPRHIDEDRAHDVVLGSAGALLGLLALHDRAGAAGVLDRARLCGEHLMHARLPDPETGLRAWTTISPLLTSGFAHGGSGIAHALLRLHARTGEPEPYDAAMEAFAFERSLLRPEIMNWPDSRYHPFGQPVRTSWCHGAPGIALARLTALEALRPDDEVEIVGDLDIALTRTGSVPPGAVDQLCCGNFGRIEVLREAGRLLGNESLARQADLLLGARLEDVGDGGFGFPSAHDAAGSRSRPGGLWRGPAGIGYALLRAANPDRLPCLLSLD